MPEVSLLGSLKSFIVGKPIPSRLADHERLTRTTGLAILSSDALSSVAYATEEILRTLVLASVTAVWISVPIAFIIAGLMLVIGFSYRQTIHAYPAGGGAYSVAKENIGAPAGLVAAAALLLDYVMTVAVSIAAGVAAVTSAFPDLHINRVEMALIFIALLAIGNLRGVRESGYIFAVPTYCFVASIIGLLGVGVWRVLSGALTPLEGGLGDAAAAALAGQGGELRDMVPTLGTFIILRSFANGCTALTGIEAISNGVSAFRRPEARNAAATLMTMIGLSVTMFLGITLLASAYGVMPSENETVVSQIARGVFGGRGVPYYIVQGATMLILVLAANTAYSDFPRLSSIIARDRFMPRQFMNQGDRLAFSNGIMVLSLLAAGLIIAFGGDTHALIPLYMIGVFVSFTLSQTGMVVKIWRERPSRWLLSVAISGVGALLAGIVLIVVSVTKFTEGAWIILTLIPIQVGVFMAIERHYRMVADQLSLIGWTPKPQPAHTVVVPVGGINRAVAEALQYARTLGSDVRAVYVDVGRRSIEEVRADWVKYGLGLRLDILESPYRSLLEPLMEYIDGIREDHPDGYLTIVLPEFVPARWWHHLLHNQRALLIKGALLFRRNLVVTNVPYHLRR